MFNRQREIIRENLTPEQVLHLIQQEREQGRRVKVTRLHSQLVEIEIIHPERILEVNPVPISHHLLNR